MATIRIHRCAAVFVGATALFMEDGPGSGFSP